jgi:hypothetical protein
MWSVLQNQFHIKDSVKNNSKICIYRYIKYICIIVKTSGNCMLLNNYAYYFIQLQYGYFKTVTCVNDEQFA